MEPPPSSRRTGIAEATLGAYGRQTRAMLVPLLLYKSVFMGDWYHELVRHERDPEVRRALMEMGRQTLGEALMMLDVMRTWDKTPQDDEAMDEFAQALQRRLILDLLILKEGSNEAVTLAAMRAQTSEMRARLMKLADLDRRHADVLRALVGASQARDALRRVERDESRAPLGAHEMRRSPGTLSAQVEAALRRTREEGHRPERLVLSHVSLRHLRDEGRIGEDGTAFGLSVDVDLAWEGECWSIVSADRLRLTELLTLGSAASAARE